MTAGDDLTHWGVKGMRWGVRKEDASSPSLGRIRASQVIKTGALVSAAIAQANAKTILKKAPKVIAKGTVKTIKVGISAARNTQRMVAGAKVAVRILGATGRGAKTYARGAIKVARALR